MPTTPVPLWQIIVTALGAALLTALSTQLGGILKHRRECHERLSCDMRVAYVRVLRLADEHHRGRRVLEGYERFVQDFGNRNRALRANLEPPSDPTVESSMLARAQAESAEVARVRGEQDRITATLRAGLTELAEASALCRLPA